MTAFFTGRRVFVTGGSGFVGGALIAALRAAGSEVVALARSHRATRAVAALGATPALGELEDTASLTAGMRGCQLVVHAAAKTNEWGSRAAFYGANVAGVAHVLAAARAAAVPRLVHISSEAVLAGGEPIVDADESAPYPPCPAGLYSWSKQLGEQAVRAASGAELATVTLRPRLVWGPGDRALLPGLVQAMRSGAWVWWGPANHPSSSCYIDNLVEATLLAAERGAPGAVYFVTDGAPTPMRGFIAALLATRGVAVRQRQLPRRLGWAAAYAGEYVWGRLGLPGQPPVERTTMNLTFEQVTVSDALARRELGYRGRVGQAEGLAALRAAG